MRIETVKLDATDQGRPLYEKMGFRFEQAVERWSRPASSNSSATTRLVDALPAGNWRRADRRAFGADRSELLERLSQRSQPSLFIGGSYLLTRSGHQTRYLGPSVCDTPETARALVARALQAEPSQRWSWDLLPNNVAAATIARDLTFTPSRRLQRMVRGNELRAKEEMIYAIAGFELG
jgi:Acetyltransferase (GNAT) domain